MTKIFAVLAGLLLFLIGASATTAQPSSAAPQDVRFVREGNANRVEKIPWHKGLTVSEVIILSGGYDSYAGGEIEFSILTKATIRTYFANLGRTSSDVVFNMLVSPGEVLVIGYTDAERASKLDKIPEINHLLGRKWADCEHRVVRSG